MLETKIAYFDRLAQRWVNSDGSRISDKKSKPFMKFALQRYLELHVVEVNPVTAAVTAVDLSIYNSFRFPVDNEYKRKYTGALSGGKGPGAVTAIRIDGLGSTFTPPATGRLSIDNAEDIDYTARVNNASGDWTFTVDASLTGTYADNTPAYVYDAPLILAENSDINATQAALGILTILLDADTPSYDETVGESAEVQNCKCALYGYDLAGIKAFEAECEFFCYNTLDDNSAVENNARANYNKSEQDARYLRILSGSQSTLTDNAQTAITVFDKTTARKCTVEMYAVGAAGVRDWHSFTVSFFGAVATLQPSSFADTGTITGTISLDADISGNNVRLLVTLAGCGENLKLVYKISQLILEA